MLGLRDPPARSRCQGRVCRRLYRPVWRPRCEISEHRTPKPVVARDSVNHRGGDPHPEGTAVRRRRSASALWLKLSVPHSDSNPIGHPLPDRSRNATLFMPLDPTISPAPQNDRESPIESVWVSSIMFVKGRDVQQCGLAPGQRTFSRQALAGYLQVPAPLAADCLRHAANGTEMAAAQRSGCRRPRGARARRISVSRAEGGRLTAVGTDVSPDRSLDSCTRVPPHAGGLSAAVVVSPGREGLAGPDTRPAQGPAERDPPRRGLPAS